MIKPTICVPITGSTQEEFLSQLASIQTKVDMVELRFDYLSAIDSEFITKVRTLTKVECIATCRSSKEGGKYRGKETDRLALLQAAMNAGYTYVDIELFACEEHQLQRTSTSKIIISYHNFTRTPQYWDLTKKIDEMRSYAPDVMKIATMVTTYNDNLSLFRLLITKLKHEHMIVLGMGEEGRISRLLSPYLGNLLTFASSEFGETAPGQLSYTELTNLFNEINSFNSK